MEVSVRYSTSERISGKVCIIWTWLLFVRSWKGCQILLTYKFTNVLLTDMNNLKYHFDLHFFGKTKERNDAVVTSRWSPVICTVGFFKALVYSLLLSSLLLFYSFFPWICSSPVVRTSDVTQSGDSILPLVSGYLTVHFPSPSFTT